MAGRHSPEYTKYINSLAWRRKVAAYWAQHGRSCKACGTTTGTLDVHHITYMTFRHERMSDLLGLCRTCHDKVHDYQREHRCTYVYATRIVTGLDVRVQPHNPKPKGEKKPKAKQNRRRGKKREPRVHVRKIGDPPPTPDELAGKTACPRCGRRIKLLPDGRFRFHYAKPRGKPGDKVCPNSPPQ